MQGGLRGLGQGQDRHQGDGSQDGGGLEGDHGQCTVGWREVITVFLFQLGETVAREEVEEAWPERQQEEEEEELEENIITPSQARPAHTPVNKGPKWFPNMVTTFK